MAKIVADGIRWHFELCFQLAVNMLGNFSSADFFFKINIVKQFFQEHYERVKWFGSRLGLCPVGPGMGKNSGLQLRV